MDGAFSVASHPRCVNRIGLPIRSDVLLNALNPNLERSKALDLYKFGYNRKDEDLLSS